MIVSEFFKRQIEKLLKTSLVSIVICNSLELAHALEHRHEPLFVYCHRRRNVHPARKMSHTANLFASEFLGKKSPPKDPSKLET